MSFPVEAFFVAHANEVPTGNFYLKNGDWFISVDANQGHPGQNSAVQLTGELTGLFFPHPAGVGTYIAGGWRIEARVSGIDQTVDHQDGNWNAALVLGDRPYLYAQYGQGDRFFDLNGMLSDGGGLSDMRRRFQKWSGWLVGPDGKTLGDEPVFSVQSIARVF